MNKGADVLAAITLKKVSCFNVYRVNCMSIER